MACSLGQGKACATSSEYMCRYTVDVNVHCVRVCVVHGSASSART